MIVIEIRPRAIRSDGERNPQKETAVFLKKKRISPNCSVFFHQKKKEEKKTRNGRLPEASSSSLHGSSWSHRLLFSLNQSTAVDCLDKADWPRPHALPSFDVVPSFFGFFSDVVGRRPFIGRLTGRRSRCRAFDNQKGKKRKRKKKKSRNDRKKGKMMEKQKQRGRAR